MLTHGRREGKWEARTSRKQERCIALKAFFMSSEASQKWGFVWRREETVCVRSSAPFLHKQL